uniref:NADH-ubiquinone oxidoreductase chain 4 n=1 Tax=Acrobeles complexus TaxID=293684 RepID=A0A0H3V3G4_9BILA|nr:NADH dehydrogenase subunit 4 [Acrobeles complexus]
MVAAFIVFTSPMYYLWMTMLCFVFLESELSWTGMFLYPESVYNVLFYHLGALVCLLVASSEESKTVIILNNLLLVLSLIFFFSESVLMMYIAYEGTLVPVVYMIVLFGGQVEKISAVYYLMMYTFICSLPFLFLIMWLGIEGSMYIKEILTWDFIPFAFAIFMVKMPVYFLHLWLPKAHVEAPTSTSMLLAGLLLKLGGVGFLRLSGCLIYYNPTLFILFGFVGLVTAPILCSYQADMKSYAAYSSVTHMCLVYMALVVSSCVSYWAGVWMMLMHGYYSTVMFYLIGSFYHESSTRMVYYFSGASESAEFFMIGFAFDLFGNSKVPPFVSFFSELNILGSLFSFNSILMLLLSFYFMVAFYYSIYMLCHLMSGQSRTLVSVQATVFVGLVVGINMLLLGASV